MDTANQLAEVINKGFDYLRTNAWAILVLIGVGYVVKTNGESSGGVTVINTVFTNASHTNS